MAKSQCNTPKCHNSDCVILFEKHHNVSGTHVSSESQLQHSQVGMNRKDMLRGINQTMNLWSLNLIHKRLMPYAAMQFCQRWSVAKDSARPIPPGPRQYKFYPLVEHQDN
eukprot:scaffold428347_cov22-Prasinocladus_malaysianus.AAC.1